MSRDHGHLVLFSFLLLLLLSSTTRSHDLRYAAFGTSRTYGRGVNPETESYIKLLSRNAANYGIRASDASGPAMCTQSILGDSIYDVIVIEYEARYEVALEALVERVRQRYPEAMIIVTDIWMYHDIFVNTPQTKNLSVRQWLVNNGHGNSKGAMEFLSNHNATYYFPPHIYDRTSYFNMLADKYNVKVYSWDKEGDKKALILFHHPFYTPDFKHFTVEGHAFIANHIREIVGQKEPSNVLGTFGDGDFCSFWLVNGIMSNLAPMSPNIVMNQFDTRKGKYALEFKEKNNTIQIVNPFNSERLLSICYMATGPNSTIYPKIEFYGNIFEPIENHYNFPVHVHLTKTIGLLDPGKNIIRVNLLEDNKFPFRLVGVFITNGKIFPSSFFNRVAPLVEMLKVPS